MKYNKDVSIIFIISLYYNFLSTQSQDGGGFCKFQQFRCEGGDCILSEKLCNGVADCPNGEDENGSEKWDCSKLTLGTSQQCGDPRKYFKCRFGGCISQNKVCDGISDCWGGTDEALENCADNRPSRPNSNPKPRPSATTPKSRPPVTRPPTFSTPTKSPTKITTKSPQRPSSPRPRPNLPPKIQISTESSADRFPNRVDEGEGGPCGPIELGEGQHVDCYQSEIAQVVDCKNKKSPQGTQATIRCMKFWSPPVTGSRTTEKTCKNGKWVGGSRRFQCDLDCGEGGNKVVGLVVGGVTSSKGKWPWHVGLYESDPPGSNNYENICGGTMISQKAILTAGHCVTVPHTNEPKNPRQLLVFLGKFFRNSKNNERQTQAIAAARVVVHPDYNYASLESDIAIIILEKSAEINNFVHPVCMPEENDEVSAGSKGTLAGWGSIGDRTYPEELQETELPVVSSYTCKKSHSALNSLIRFSNFCAGFKNGTSACDGDSGGGLIFSDSSRKDSFKWVIQGVVSGGVQPESGRGCDPKQYVAFTKVSVFRDWIDKVLDSYGHDYRK